MLEHHFINTGWEYDFNSNLVVLFQCFCLDFYIFRAFVEEVRWHFGAHYIC